MRSFFLILSCLFLFSCNKNSSPLQPIDGQATMKLVEKQVSFGPRYSDSQAIINCAEWMKSYAKELGFKAEIDSWSESRHGEFITFRNLIITYRPPSYQGKDFLLIGSHYDTKRLPGIKTWQSANDGPSSTALLLQILRQIKEQEQDWQNSCELRFLIFDGEECQHQYADHDGLHGSKRYAQQLKKNEKLSHCRGFLLADLVGDKDLHISFPKNNSKKLAQQALNIAQQQGLSAYFSQGHSAIIDDFVPFHEMGIPCLDFIDFNFGPNNRYWHTEEDSIDKLSPKSLEICGNVFQDLIWKLSSSHD